MKNHLALIRSNDIFSITDSIDFNETSLKIFRFQSINNAVYRNYIEALGVVAEDVTSLEEIPFLPVEFFKTHQVISGAVPGEPLVFFSSGTVSGLRSRHHVPEPELYKASIREGFQRFFGSPGSFDFFFLVPEPEIAKNSSLAYMCRELQTLSGGTDRRFFLGREDELHNELSVRSSSKRFFLLGISYALLDFFQSFPGRYNDGIILETGGMKGRREEMIREELHRELCKNSGAEIIHSEYGMAELLSQAWSAGGGSFRCPPWMKIMIRDAQDPLSWAKPGKTGGVNVVDLANVYSCSFIATQDLGKINEDGSFVIEGRFDDSEARGCSLLLTK